MIANMKTLRMGGGRAGNNLYWNEPRHANLEYSNILTIPNMSKIRLFQNLGKLRDTLPLRVVVTQHAPMCRGCGSHHTHSACGAYAQLVAHSQSIVSARASVCDQSPPAARNIWSLPCLCMTGPRGLCPATVSTAPRPPDGGAANNCGLDVGAAHGHAARGAGDAHRGEAVPRL